MSQSSSMGLTPPPKAINLLQTQRLFASKRNSCFEEFIDSSRSVRITDVQHLLITMNRMMRDYIKKRSDEDPTIDPKRFQTNVRFFIMWFALNADAV